MKCKLQSLFLLLLLFLVSSGSSFGQDVTLTQDEYNELLTLQTQQESTLIQQAQTIRNLESELTTLKSLQTQQAEIIRMLSQLINDLKKSLNALASDPIDLELGVLADTDFAGNYKAGIYAGVRFELY